MSDLEKILEFVEQDIERIEKWGREIEEFLGSTKCATGYSQRTLALVRVRDFIERLIQDQLTPEPRNVSKGTSY